ncbi:unnamed protein product, partial [Ectocarpus fasciculatus]
RRRGATANTTVRTVATLKPLGRPRGRATAFVHASGRPDRGVRGRRSARRGGCGRHRRYGSMRPLRRRSPRRRRRRRFRRGGAAVQQPPGRRERGRHSRRRPP